MLNCDTFSEVLNSCRSLDYTHDNESVIYSNDLYRPVENTHFTSYPAAKHQNTENLGLQTYEQTSRHFMAPHERRL